MGGDRGKRGQVGGGDNRKNGRRGSGKLPKNPHKRQRTNRNKKGSVTGGKRQDHAATARRIIGSQQEGPGTLYAQAAPRLLVLRS